MSVTRRRFLQSAAACGLSAAVTRGVFGDRGPKRARYERLDRAAAQPVLQLDSLKFPVKIETMELLRNGGTFLVRVRTTEGAEGLAVPNSSRLKDVYPLFVNRVAPFFAGKDARRLEPLLWDLYRFRSNYKFQGLALWVCVAAAEFAVLDLLGRLAKKPVGDLLGGVKRREVAVYRASGNRGNKPRAEIAYLQKLVAQTGAKAIKFRVGGRMSKNRDSLPGRTETLIPLVRKTFGETMTLYADSNSSYDAKEAVRVGRLMEKYRYGFFEEPCRFDHLQETKRVADALTIPIAGGEQEFSHDRFRWAIANRAVDVVQPDLHYYGGFIRSMRVARMAHAAGMTCVPHMSGSGLGYVDVLHFVSCIPNPGPHHEFKGTTKLPVESETSSLKPQKGVIRVPSGPGFGYTLDPAWVRRAKPVKPI